MRILYCNKVNCTAMLTFLLTVFISNTCFSSPYQYGCLSKDERVELREQAVIEARAGCYQKALDVLRNLYNSDKNDVNVVYDYITVLHWDGQHQEAIDVFESNNYSGLPDYVVLNVAAAYYRLNKYDKALDILQPIVSNYNKDAMILQAQIFIKQNNSNLAEEIFDRMSGALADEDILRIKTETALSLNNWQWSVSLWNKALVEKDNGMYPGISKEELVDKLSTAYLRIGRPKDSLKLLQPYIKNKTASVNMIGNYIVGLHKSKNYRMAIAVYRTFFYGIDDVPVFILREIAECFYKTGNYVEAAKIYVHIQEKGYAGREDKFRLAYIGSHTKKYKEIGIKAYADILKNHRSSDTITRTLVEASNILQQGRLDVADSVYKMLIAIDERFLRLYIDDLMREGQYQTAWNMAEMMKKSNSKVLSNIALEKLTSIAIALRDYNTAAAYQKQLSERLDEEFAYSEASGSYKNKLQGEMYVYANTYNDDDDSNSIDFGIYATQYLGDGLWGDVEEGRTYVKDNGRTIAIDMSKIGLRHTGRKFDNLVGASLFKGAGSDKVGLTVDSLFRPDDRQNLHFTYNNIPVADIGALEYEQGAIFTDMFALRYTYQLNQHESVYAEIRQNNYDFDNKMKGWTVAHELQLYNDFNKGRNLYRNIHWYRNRFSNQDVPYTSPKLEESIGVEWKWSRDLKHNDALVYALGCNWEKDYPERFSFNPYARFEYQRAFSRHQYLTVGCSYGLESESSLGKGSWRFNENNFDITYNLTW